MFKKDIPTFLEVDFLTLTIVFLKKEDNFFKKNKFFSKFFSCYLLKSYNWKKLI